MRCMLGCAILGTSKRIENEMGNLPMMNDQQTIKRRNDGSIDTAHYIDKGRHARNHQAHSLAGKFPGKTVAIVCVAVFAFLAVLGAHPVNLV